LINYKDLIYSDGKFPDALEMPMKDGYQEAVLDKEAKILERSSTLYKTLI
jgi:hypothetical protein